MFACVCTETPFPEEYNQLITANCSNVFPVGKFVLVTFSRGVSSSLIPPPSQTAVGNPLDIYDRQVIICFLFCFLIDLLRSLSPRHFSWPSFARILLFSFHSLAKCFDSSGQSRLIQWHCLLLKEKIGGYDIENKAN